MRNLEIGEDEAIASVPEAPSTTAAEPTLASRPPRPLHWLAEAVRVLGLSRGVERYYDVRSIEQRRLIVRRGTSLAYPVLALLLTALLVPRLLAAVALFVGFCYVIYMTPTHMGDAIVSHVLIEHAAGMALRCVAERELVANGFLLATPISAVYRAERRTQQRQLIALRARVADAIDALWAHQDALARHHDKLARAVRQVPLDNELVLRGDPCDLQVLRARLGATVARRLAIEDVLCVGAASESTWAVWRTCCTISVWLAFDATPQRLDAMRHQLLVARLRARGYLINFLSFCL